MGDYYCKILKIFMGIEYLNPQDHVVLKQQQILPPTVKIYVILIACKSSLHDKQGWWLNFFAWISFIKYFIGSFPYYIVLVNNCYRFWRTWLKVSVEYAYNNKLIFFMYIIKRGPSLLVTCCFHVQNVCNFPNRVVALWIGLKGINILAN